MRAPVSMQQAIAAVPALPLEQAVVWLRQYGGDRVRPVDKQGRRWTVVPVDADGKRAGDELVLTEEQVVARYRAKAARLAQGAGG